MLTKAEARQVAGRLVEAGPGADLQDLARELGKVVPGLTRAQLADIGAGVWARQGQVQRHPVGASIEAGRATRSRGGRPNALLKARLDAKDPGAFGSTAQRRRLQATLRAAAQSPEVQPLPLGFKLGVVGVMVFVAFLAELQSWG
ncbi:MAG: hypothetical protein IPG45_14935 [Deltaproteobacteria bacterium]|nr:hypothetical protein [Deltaproteobacteria bacterium]